jgi:Regulator of ribonuclease activity B/Immunity protein 26
MKLNYSEGIWFAVPLDSGGFGVGIVARATKKGPVILVYLFGPKREAVPSLSEVAGLDPSAAVTVLRIGDLHLIDGTWPILGRSPTWQRERWPMPLFTRKPPFINHELVIQYSDDDPSWPALPEGLPQGVRYSLYIPKRKKADALAAQLRGEGFEVETRLGADETNWLVLVTHPSLDEDTIDRLEEQFTKYAEASGGEYDGYER